VEAAQAYPAGPSASAALTPAVTSGTFTPKPVSILPAGIDTTALAEVPNPLSGDNPRYPEEALTLPAVGVVFHDAGLGTSIERVTGRPGVRHEYSRFDPFNADKSMIILLDVSEGSFTVFRTIEPYDRPENRVRVLDLEEPRWDRADPDRVTGFSGFRMVSVNVLTGEEVTLKDFAADPTIGPLITADNDLYRITMRNEGEASLDGDWWALALQGSREDHRLRYLFCWHRSTDEVVGLGELEFDQAEIDWLGMSPLGNWVLIGADPSNRGPLTGFTIADRELTEFHQINYDTSHADVALDVNGDEVLVMQNSRTDHVDLFPLAASTTPVMQSGVDYQGSDHVPLLRLFYDSGSPIGFEGGVHISGNAPGYALVSTYQDPDRPEKNWLDRSIVLIRLDPDAPRVYHVAKTHNVTKEYWEETHATISNDGHTVVWAGDFGIAVGEERTYLLRLDLP